MAGRLTLSVLFFVSLILAGPVKAQCTLTPDGLDIVDPLQCGVIFTYTENNNTGNNVALGYPPPQPIASLTAGDFFREYASLMAQHQALMMINPEVRGTIIGQAGGGSDIWAYQIGDADNVTNDGFTESAILMSATTHAREWQPAETVTELMETLVEQKTDAGMVQYLFDNVNMVLVPVVNVDGFLQTQMFWNQVTAFVAPPREGRMRRKTMRDSATLQIVDNDLGTPIDNFNGVDQNRNNEVGFGLNNRSSPSPTNIVHRGPMPASEPETMALRVAAALGPENRLRLYIDNHSFTQVFFGPQTGNVRRDGIAGTLANRMRAVLANKYAYSPSPVGSGGIGANDDFFAGTYQIPSYTLETEPLNGGQDYGGTGISHSGFITPDSDIARLRDEIVRMVVFGFFRQGGPPSIEAAQISEVGSGTVVYNASWTNSGPTSRILSVTTNDALVPGNQYRLWLAFNKPMRYRDAMGAIVPYPGQTTGANAGSATLEAPTLSNSDMPLAIGNANVWLDQPGGAPNGYLRYRDDALTVEFTVPNTLVLSGPTPLILSVTNRDLSTLNLDADPASAADWAAGHWVRYNDAAGVAGDIGGTDCTIRPFMGPAAGAMPPINTANCSAVPPPPPPPPPPRPSGGGGGSLGWLLIVVLLGMRPRARVS